LRPKDRLPLTDGVRTECPRDLDVTGLSERRELVRRQRAERDVGFPGLRDGADHDLTSGTLGEHAPPQGLELGEESAWPSSLVRRGAEDQLAALEDRADEWQMEEVHGLRHVERDRCRCRDAHVMTFDHLVGRHEPIEQSIEFVPGWTSHVTVATPRDADI
jgi:hypothetical protein